MAERPFVFVSYSRADSELVLEIAAELTRLGIDLWVDANNLVAGVSWSDAIRSALSRASAVLVFLSPTSRKSEWVLDELHHAVSSGMRVLPVIIGGMALADRPLGFGGLQYFEANSLPPLEAARRIAEILRPWLSDNRSPASDAAGQDELARALAAQSKGAENALEEDAPRSVFVVHGHDDDMLSDVVDFLQLQSIEPVVLRNIGGANQSLLRKFFDFAGRARFAIVLMSADDMGASRVQFEQPGVGERALKYRSRQNVILELGYFYGALGWDNVFVLEKPAPLNFPDFERPSDLNGVVFDRMDARGQWKALIAERLEKSGFKLPGFQSQS